VAEKATSGGGRATSRRTGTTGKASTSRASTSRAATTRAAATSRGGTTRAAATRAGGATKRASATAAATDRMAAKATDITHPERSVVKDPPPAPDYPRFRVEPGTYLRLTDVDPDESEHYQRKKDVADELKRHRDRISDLQAKLYGEQKRSLLIVLQAMDTGGKDGTIKGVFQGVNPQGCQVWSFKAPSSEESAHDFLWRYHQKTPPKGMIHIFNRSHYEDVLIVRVKGLVPESVWRPRFEAINQFEYALTSDGVTVLKFFLHISKDEQKRRLESRLADPDKNWKFSTNDLKERAYWDDYQAAFEDAINSCSSDYAPWYVVPANKKWYRNLVVARTIADTLEAMDPRFPAAEKGLENVQVPD
jgi:PPK2 family polyphosphate:nucleotide phosphotransferase